MKDIDTLVVKMKKYSYFDYHIRAYINDLYVGQLNFSIDCAPSKLHVTSLSVRKDNQRRGVATKIYEYFKKHFADFHIWGELEHEGIKFHGRKEGGPCVHNRPSIETRRLAESKDFPNPEPEITHVPKGGHFVRDAIAKQDDVHERL